MSLTAIVTLLAGLLTLIPVVKWWIQRAKLIRAIDLIPGPKAYPLIGTTYIFWGVPRKDIIAKLEKMKQPFPDIFRVWIATVPAVEIRKAEYLEKILTSNKQHMEKAWFYRYVKEWLGDGLLMATGQKWYSHRKIITPTFHFSILDGFCEIFSEKSRILVQKLEQHADTGKSFDVYPYITKAALDIIADAAMGTQLNAQDNQEIEYVRAVYETAASVIHRMTRPWLIPDFVYNRTKAGKSYAKRISILHGFTQNVIKQRQENLKQTNNQGNQQIVNEDKSIMGKKKRLAFLDLLLASNELSDIDIREEVDTFMFEGHDTTTGGIAWALLMLGLHQDVQDQVFAELEEIFGGSDRHATVQDFNDMKVLDRVIKETLRLYPSVPIIGRILSEDITFDQYTVPAGCTVLMSIVSLHRDERAFPDPEKFDPDRFLPENTIGRHPYAYIPFSAGSRNCIGQKFAIYEEKAVLSELLRSYRFRTVGKREDVEQVFELTLRPLNGIMMTLEKRVRVGQSKI